MKWKIVFTLIKHLLYGFITENKENVTCYQDMLLGQKKCQIYWPDSHKLKYAGNTTMHSNLNSQGKITAIRNAL